MTLSSRYKRRVLTRLVKSQGGRCCYCNRLFTVFGITRPTLEHRKAKMDGGRDSVKNLAAACFHCNQHRGRQMVRDRLTAAKQLSKKPTEAALPEVNN
ncbi:HNH endonuclease [Mesorhizobium sp. CA6]|uniref:HNH endonuclease n=1 Tax=Mesorhizobium sp. CA6 TaxID=588500 RepID=UPI001CCA85F8|nr:HNH endonuclease [Mesorhizobium sp. CA6]MBZ9767127.1 HNH endonuclease [Mesorhizobium sp. CA6]